MKKKSRSIISKDALNYPPRKIIIDNIAYPLAGILIILLIWQLVCLSGLVPAFALPAPLHVLKSFIDEFPVLMSHARVSLCEAFAGLLGAVALAFLFAVLMDQFEAMYNTLYPLLIATQTVPVIAIAPLLVLWLGYGVAPKVAVIMITCFFPLAVGLLDALRTVDPDVVNLLKAMGANRRQVFAHVKLPGTLPAFFSGLRIAVSYSVVGAVIAEWLGGDMGLGVYMTRVRKSYAFDKMFAVILLISLISLLLIWLVSLLEKRAMPWLNIQHKGEGKL